MSYRKAEQNHSQYMPNYCIMSEGVNHQLLRIFPRRFPRRFLKGFQRRGIQPQILRLVTHVGKTPWWKNSRLRVNSYPNRSRTGRMRRKHHINSKVRVQQWMKGTSRVYQNWFVAQGVRELNRTDMDTKPWFSLSSEKCNEIGVIYVMDNWSTSWCCVLYTVLLPIEII